MRFRTIPARYGGVILQYRKKATDEWRPWLSMGGRAHTIFTSEEVAQKFIKSINHKKGGRKRK